MKLHTRKICVLLAVLMLVMTSACTPVANVNNTDTNTNEAINNTPEPQLPPEFTLQLASQALATDWNPHTWKSNADADLIEFITSPLVDISIKDSETGEYQWVYEMAESIRDVTADNIEDLTKYSVSIPAANPAEPVAEGYVYEIKLNKNAKWADGKAVTADDYIYSMEQLLDPQLQNYRASRFVSGNLRVAGGDRYYHSGQPVYVCAASRDLGFYYDYNTAVAQGIVYVNVDSSDYQFHSMSLSQLNQAYSFGYATELEMLRRQADEYGYTLITEENRAMIEEIMRNMLLKVFGISYIPQMDEAYREALFVRTGMVEEADFDSVGLYKVDDYTLRYVCAQQTGFNEFMSLLTSPWLVYKDYYEAAKNVAEGSAAYCSSIENTMSYGPYMLSSVSAEKMELIQNPNWYGWEEGEDGALVSFTGFEVDGSKQQQYRTTKIEISAMTDAQAERAFLDGELAKWSVADSDYLRYKESEKLYNIDETFTWSLFFNTNFAYLSALDESGKNTNSVVLSNLNFRRAFSLCIDREEFVQSTEGYHPAIGLMNSLYYYDAYNDPFSAYRSSDEAMTAITELYEVTYGEDQEKKTLEEAYASVSGYDPEKASDLMKLAHDELLGAGRYTDGEDIKIQVAYKADAISALDLRQIELLNKYLNEAAKDSGFGTITLEAVGGVRDRSGAVTTGDYAIGCGAWGGAAVFPFENMKVYCDPDHYKINEGADWDPRTETLTMALDGYLTTKTWQEWSLSLGSGGIYENQRLELKLYVASVLEKEFLKKFFRIPVAATTAHELLSFKNDYYTHNYNIMYGFGGIRLLKYNYNDKDWAEFVEKYSDELPYRTD